MAQSKGLNPVIRAPDSAVFNKIAAEDTWLREVGEVVAAENGLLGWSHGPIDAANELIFILRQREAVHQFAARVGRQPGCT